MGGFPAEQLKSAWNDIEGVRKVYTMSDNRKKALRARWGNPWWRENWQKALDTIPNCPGLLGQNERKWKANIDWFLRPGVVAKILEGFYDEWGKGGDDEYGLND